MELVGFKSFAQKTVLDFPAGITAVVGPNGSGKSNIIDAVRWILGEREAKNIRGARAEDLIFAGTPQRPRMGMAQVTMLFDNTSHFFPVDYNEVSIKRQVTRDGISTYFLNDSEVRLKDVVDFFAKSRLGTKGLTIVNQGNSDIFVGATPKERRVMIEEVLGLRQYQLKKHDSELKLASTKVNLEKVKALIEEIAPHLRLLRRQAAKWDKQAELAEELKKMEASYFGGKLKVIENDYKALEPQIRTIEQAISDKRKELKQLHEELAKVEKSGPKGDRGYEDFKKKQQEFLNKKAAAQKELGRLEGQIDFYLRQPKAELQASEAVGLLEETRGLLKKALADNDFASFKNLLGVLVDKLDKALAQSGSEREAKIAELEKMKKKLAETGDAIDKELAGLSAAEAKLADELRGFNAIFKKAFEAVEGKKDEVTALENEKNKLLFEKERITIRKQELEHLAAQSGRKLSEFAPLAPNGLDFADLERRMFRLRAELAGIGELDPAMIKEAKETETRHTFLSQQSEDLDKASEDLGQLIEDLDEKIHSEFSKAMGEINRQFNEFFKTIFGGGRAHLRLQKPEAKLNTISSEEVTTGESEILDEDAEHAVDHGGIEIEVTIPRKKVSGLDALSGGERTLVSVSALFALISVSPPPFLVLDEIDAPLDEKNTRRFAAVIKDFAKKTQFVLVTHNRATMEAADILYGVTMADDGTSRVLSLKLEDEAAVKN